MPVSSNLHVKAGVVVRTVPRVAPERLVPLAAFGVATVHEAIGRRGLMASSLRPIYRGASIAGPAVTVSVTPGDNTMIHVVVELCQAGDVLVISPTSPCEDGYFGDLFATALKARGVQGLIIDAGVRDIRTLAEMGFPVWSKVVHAQGTVKESLGNINVPIVCGGLDVVPGDIIVADDDGVMVLARQQLDAALAAAQARTEKETRNRARFAAGEVGLDVYGMCEKLAGKGLVYVEQLSDIARPK